MGAGRCDATAWMSSGGSEASRLLPFAGGVPAGCGGAGVVLAGAGRLQSSEVIAVAARVEG